MVNMTLQEALDDCQALAEVGGKYTVELDCPVLLIFGYDNRAVTSFISSYKQMTDVWLAFAKVMPNAMAKTLGRLFGEIGNDHRERQEQQQQLRQQRQLEQ
eukprot:TRINITY_DN476_c0_g1_i4.p1 TRINITY_DN476_c0_g1~~TRINITY_DN476_c0_g1_i4.p1  ORF type:complete len:101 (+),score=28.13 TRINITY_DN476_c0_g1_i4:508-810(+)